MKECVVAFVGNPNVGKSAWINLLANAQFKVGNWPGVTVEKKEAKIVYTNGLIAPSGGGPVTGTYNGNLQ